MPDALHDSRALPDLSALIRPGERVVCGQVGAEPLTLTRALVEQRSALAGVELFLGSVFSDTFSAAQANCLQFRSYGAMGRTFPLARAGALRIVPSHYSELEQAFEQRQLEADVVLLQLAPSRRGRGFSLGLANDYVAAAARRARLVIAEINPAAPWTHGAELTPDLPIHVSIEAVFPPLELPSGKPTETERAIAARIAEIVPDGATVQTGIGGLPDAVMSGLAGHRDLGVHSGLIGGCRYERAQVDRRRRHGDQHGGWIAPDLASPRRQPGGSRASRHLHARRVDARAHRAAFFDQLGARARPLGPGER
jgi:acyl-CoA hydrolase